MASQLMVDLYDCDEGLLNDLERIRELAGRMIAEIGSEIVEECVHEFQPIGITYIAVITTSHFSIHTWPEYGYAAVDIFSCKEGLPMEIAEKLKEAFGAKRHTVNGFKRDIGGRN
ncbi:MAG: adenosylmethionine decarboxylase [Lachnospiraceae bacterium]|nr:adenosylmethionine decarboxylase [Lachnospiraceae bacterium]